VGLKEAIRRVYCKMCRYRERCEEDNYFCPFLMLRIAMHEANIKMLVEEAEKRLKRGEER